MSNNINAMFDKFISHYSSKDTGKGNQVLVAGTIATFTMDDENIILGLDTLRCVYNQNSKNAIIGLTPSKTSIGSYVRDIDLTFSVLSDGFNTNYNRLYVDGGELFQYSTVHDFDFTIYKDFLAKYLELLKVLKVSPRIKNPSPTIDEAIDNVSEALKLYSKEA